MKTKRIFKKSLAEKLIIIGCNLIETEPNNRNEKLVVYVFEDNKKLRLALTALSI
ncbi:MULTISPECIES: DUF5659 domain-containing protein [Bacillus cereus group]|uniref:DUF5659 domain-containing protein n=1 Tax=Bacillus cereus group TaxID=86661 RepID=UPI00178C6AE9|nr:DUF5659 domain-containing protein [Bacillus cereus]